MNFQTISKYYPGASFPRLPVFREVLRFSIIYVARTTNDVTGTT